MKNTEATPRKASNRVRYLKLFPSKRKILNLFLICLQVNADTREEAWRQAQVLATLSDPNIAALLGVVSRDDPLLLVLEYPPLADLNQYLRRHVPDTTTPRLNHMRHIRSVL